MCKHKRYKMDFRNGFDRLPAKNRKQIATTTYVVFNFRFKSVEKLL